MSESPPVEAAEAPEDGNRRRLMQCAGACIDHIRMVRFGHATAEYSVPDGDLQIDVSIKVSCFGLRVPKDAKVADGV